jgi:hypothetical protein
MRTQLTALSLCFLFLWPTRVFADTLDVSGLSRFGDYGSVGEIVLLDAVFMAINYGLNFLFVGLPVMRLGNIPPRRMASDLVLFTFAGQVADRLGAVIAGVIAGPEVARSVYRYHDDPTSAHLYFVLNFVLSGIALGILALFFCGRWRVSARGRSLVAILAAILTNPAYVMIIQASRYERIAA